MTTKLASELMPSDVAKALGYNQEFFKGRNDMYLAIHVCNFEKYMNYDLYSCASMFVHSCLNIIKEVLKFCKALKAP